MDFKNLLEEGRSIYIEKGEESMHYFRYKNKYFKEYYNTNNRSNQYRREFKDLQEATKSLENNANLFSYYNYTGLHFRKNHLGKWEEFAFFENLKLPD